MKYHCNNYKIYNIINFNLINNYEEKINYLESKIKQLENENNLMSEKLFSSVKKVINNEKYSFYKEKEFVNLW